MIIFWGKILIAYQNLFGKNTSIILLLQNQRLTKVAEKIFTAEAKAKIIEVRFPFSGKIIKVVKKKKDQVKKGDLLASLDRRTLQLELDRQLADYEKTRADFEIFNLKNPSINNDLLKHLKTEKQAQLNKAVKEVELAKEKLNYADLFSPIEGTIIDDSNIAPGIYITPSLTPFKILDISSFYFEIKIGQKEIPLFEKPQKAEINLLGLQKTIIGKTKPAWREGREFVVEIELEAEQKRNLLLGLKGKASFKNLEN